MAKAAERKHLRQVTYFSLAPGQVTALMKYAIHILEIERDPSIVVNKSTNMRVGNEIVATILNVGVSQRGSLTDRLE